MNARPIYRWKLFWLGVLVVAFIGHGWWNSMNDLRCVRGPYCAGIQAAGGVALTFDTMTTSGWKSFRMEEPYHLDQSDVRQRSEVNFVASTVLPPVESPVIAASCGVVTVFLPYWLILVGFLVPWGGLLMWRWRRQGDLTEVIR